MQVIVTGGAGFIGSHVADLFVARGHQVTVLDNLSTGSRANVNRSARFCRVDITDAAAVKSIFLKIRPHAVLHLAGQINLRTSVQAPAEDAHANIVGSLNCLQACAAARVRRVVFASSGGTVYAEQEPFPADEDHPTNPISPYGIAKLTVERYLAYFERTHRLQYAILRLANVYGPRQSPHGEAGVVAIFIDKMLKGERPKINGDGRQTRDFIYVADVATAFLRATRLNGIFNVGTSREVSVNELYAAIAAKLAFPHPALHGPPKAGEVRRNSLNASKLKPWRPKVSLDEGLDKTIAWFNATEQTRS